MLKAVVNKEIATIGAKFKWKLSAGKIADGENTDSITIDSQELDGEIIVTVEIEGIAALCQKSASFSFNVAPIGIIDVRVVDSFISNDKWERTLVRLDSFASELLNDQDYVANIISYKGKDDNFEKIKAHLLKIKKYLIVKRKVPAGRIILFLSEGNDEDDSRTELYLFPKGDDYFTSNKNVTIIN